MLARLDPALELAINSLQGLSLEPEEKTNQSNPNNNNLSTSTKYGSDHQYWAELLVEEMMKASSIDDARSRALKAIDVLENSMNAKHREQTETLKKENWILKRAVVIQHGNLQRGNEELQKMRETVSGYQEELRALEVKNYALAMHLKQAQQENNTPIVTQRFPPDVF